ncbi:phosphomevalonate kinase [Plasmodiophora brassicae]|nr:hypothetical protein PBRA_005924 [Plasmodiophora brassicae]
MRATNAAPSWVDAEWSRWASDTDDGSIVICSAPGKVLLTGGYLILDRHYSGVVVSTSSRMTCRLGSIRPGSHTDTVVVLLAPQLASEPFLWKVSDRGPHDMFAVNGPDNPFVINTVAICLSVLRDLLRPDAFRQCLGAGLVIHSQGDPEFYSDIDEHGVAKSKTGLGSSAAVVSALVGCMFRYFGALESGSTTAKPEFADSDWMNICHRTAQLCHSAAQGKVGSGFDVSAAFFGSQVYRRLSSEVLSRLLGPSMTPALVASSLLDGTLWDMESSPVEIPALVTLVLADIRGGSSTPGMVRQVLQWRAACPQEANSMWASIALLNDKVRALFVKLSDLAKVDFSAYRRDVNACAEPCPEEWAATEVGSVLADIRVTFEAIRRNMKAMGEQCSVGIEPDSQTMLLDKTMSVPGVLCAGVPGAGGYDAAFALCLGEHGTARARLASLWSSWPGSTVTMLPATIVSRGLTFL